jgi:Uma2 family endonuclease
MDNEVKEPAPKYNYISPDEYLEMERASDQKHEYYDGLVIAMSGASRAHNRIAMNLYAEVGSFLKGKSCMMYPSDMRVSTPGRDAYIYPDASIICGESKMEDDKFDTLINPTVVIEILSHSTRKNDVGYKLLGYQQIPSVKEYIMIDSTKRFAQTVRKESNGAWRFENIAGEESQVIIQSIDFSISLDEIYRDTGL